ncbi:unnamed protein product [Rhizophagus irregularis]|uniref:Uncharacterized protein n=1 Tax=Rhizophagus irregularis TaxID=588596 RepID=A0A915ZNR2_9GLOM|nr:unnamed protein product [Rhizophagus irregularis]
MTDNNTANDSSENTQDGRTHDLQASDNNNDSTNNTNVSTSYKQEYEDLIEVLKEKDKEIETLKQKTIELENEANTTNYKQEK